MGIFSVRMYQGGEVYYFDGTKWIFIFNFMSFDFNDVGKIWLLDGIPDIVLIKVYKEGRKYKQIKKPAEKFELMISV